MLINIIKLIIFLVIVVLSTIYVTKIDFNNYSVEQIALLIIAFSIFVPILIGIIAYFYSSKRDKQLVEMAKDMGMEYQKSSGETMANYIFG